MSVEQAAVALGWIAIVILAFAIAGLVRQVREIRATVLDGFGPSFLLQRAPWVLHPAKQRKSCLILVLPAPEAGQGLVDAFARRAQMEEEVDFKILLGQGSLGAEPPGVTTVSDRPVFELLKMPWYPALVHVSSEGLVMDASPVGGADALVELLQQFLSTQVPSSQEKGAKQ